MSPTRGALALDSAAQHAAGHIRINLLWLWKLRWAAAFGQLLTIAMVAFALDIPLPLGALLLIVAVSASSNLALGAWIGRRPSAEGIELWRRRSERLLGSLMIVDTLFLTSLLYVTGGPHNPFSVFYLVHIVLAAVLLKKSWAWWLNLVSIGCYVLIFVRHLPLPGLGWGPARSTTFGDVRLQGLLAAFVTAATIIVYFVARVRHELEERERELERERERKASADRVEALVTLAAGAAHELSTPLSTIAVIGRELELELERSASGELADAVADVRLIKAEVRRCRLILDQMADQAGENVGEAMTRLTLDELLTGVLDPLHAQDRVDVHYGTAARDQALFVPKNALKRAIRGLVKNGLDASDPSGVVVIDVDRREETLILTVRDRGEGMTPEVLERAQDPFFTTKDPGCGMGLGLYLARSVIERLGGNLEIRSTSGRGTSATMRLPLRDGAAARAAI